MKLAKFLRTPFLQNTSGWLLLIFAKRRVKFWLVPFLKTLNCTSMERVGVGNPLSWLLSMTVTTWMFLVLRQIFLVTRTFSLNSPHSGCLRLTGLVFFTRCFLWAYENAQSSSNVLRSNWFQNLCSKYVYEMLIPICL